MTHTAIIRLSEDQARRLGDLIGEDETLGYPTVDAVELSGEDWQLTVFFPQKPTVGQRRRLDLLADQFLGKRRSALVVSKLPDADWVAKSLEGLRPVRAGRFLVHGRHDRDARRSNDIAVEIEAGQAFGTGHHGTTAGCLLAIESVARMRPFGSALDLGTGSGVLAIAIAKTWRVPVLATDIDPVAERVARENCRLNGVGTLVETHTAAGLRHPAFNRRAPFDLIVANILAGPLTRLAPELTNHLASSGIVILSGILPGQGRMVTAAYCNAGLRMVRINRRDGWLTLIFARG